VAAQRRRATAGDGPQHGQLLEIQPWALFKESIALRVE
jgi:hypothetical protein